MQQSNKEHVRPPTNQADTDKKIPQRVLETFISSNLYRTLNGILDDEALSIFREETLEALKMIGNGNSGNKKDEFNAAALTNEMHDYLEDCMVDIDYEILRDFV